jgi:two-component system catabolic regulation response regulator CreB
MAGSRILIVDDEPSIVDNVRYVLERDGFETASCALAAEALELLREGGFDLVVLDVGLPDGSGVEVCRALRTFSSTPVLFLTARDDEIDRVVGLEVGGDDYLGKPFSPRELAARVRAILRRVVPAGAVRPSGLRVDAAARRAYFGDRALELTRYEFGLLAALLERPGHVLDRERLLALVWSDPLAVSDRVVDTHVKTLRAKLEAAGAPAALIRTHRGVGYSAEPGS